MKTDKEIVEEIISQHPGTDPEILQNAIDRILPNLIIFTGLIRLTFMII